jgi:hypothetical protein
MGHCEPPSPVKLIVGILAADDRCLRAAIEAVTATFGPGDLHSEVWSFTQTEYYKKEAGEHILRQFVSIEKLVDPGELASIKHRTNAMEIELAERLNAGLSRPVNLDPGLIEPSKLVLASTKNFAHRIYIGQNMYAEVTLSFHQGVWKSYPFTFPDFRDDRYHGFLSKVREQLVEQRRKKI